VFENTECQWPLFYCYEIINGCFEKDDEAVEKYSDMLDDVRRSFYLLKIKSTYLKEILTSLNGNIGTYQGV
jgi:hypothetical protein